MKHSGNFRNMMRLVRLIRPLTGYMILAVSMGAIGFLCAISIPVFGGAALLDSMGYHTFLSTSITLIGIGTFAVLRAFLKYGEQACNHYIAFKVLALIRDKVFNSLRKLCPAKLEGKDKGDLISVITSDVELLEVFYAHTISPVLIAILVSAFMVYVIYSFHPLLALIALAAYLTVGFLLPFIISKISADSAGQFRSKSGELSGFVLDSLRGIQESIQYGAGQQKLKELDERTDILASYEEKQKRNAGRSMAVTNIIILAFDLVMIGVGVILFQNRQISFDAWLLSVIIMMSSFGPVIALANLGSTLQNTFAAARRVLAILDEEPLVKDIDNKEPTSFYEASLENVTFTYKDTTVLSDINLKMNANQIIGIAGKSGSGKSTILKLLMRFWDVDQGLVKLSEKDIRKINTDDLRRMEGYLTQDTHLFHGSIRHNLLIAKSDATEEEIITACQQASIHDFILGLPKGYDTQVGELGNTLSGGERQRIGLARVFLHEAPFILLDEPTSNLDSLNEAIILKSIMEIRNGKSIVLVSHRPSTMKITDVVFTMDSGRLS